MRAHGVNIASSGSISKDAFQQPQVPQLATAVRADKRQPFERLQWRHDSKSAVNLSAFSRLFPLSSVSVWQKSDRLYSEHRNERSLELKILLR